MALLSHTFGPGPNRVRRRSVAGPGTLGQPALIAAPADDLPEATHHANTQWRSTMPDYTQIHVTIEGLRALHFTSESDEEMASHLDRLFQRDADGRPVPEPVRFGSDGRTRRAPSSTSRAPARVRRIPSTAGSLSIPRWRGAPTARCRGSSPRSRARPR